MTSERGKRWWAVAALATAVIFGGCPSEGSDPRQETLQSLAEVTAQGQMEAFATEAAGLATAAADLCAGSGTLAAAQDAWWAARTPLKHLELVKFGPVTEYPERVGPKLDDWPVNASAVEELVAGDDALDFSSFGSAVRGLPVVEYLLWGSEPLDGRRCDVLAGAAADVQANAELLVTAWRDEWAARIGDPAGEMPWETPQDAVNEWVNRMIFTVENLRFTRLGKPAGDDNGGTPQPTLLESRASGRSLEDARDVLDGVRLVWGENPRGVGALLIDQDLAASVDAAFDAADAALDAIPEPLEDGLVAEPEAIDAAQESLRELQVLLQVDVAQALGVTIAFNDNDGD